MHRLLAPSFTLIAVIGWSSPALADGGGGNGSAGVGAGGVTVVVGTGSSPGHSGGGSSDSAPAPACGLEYIDGHDMPNLTDNSTQGYWVIDTCKMQALDPKSMTWVPTTPGGPAPQASVIAQTALSKASWPTVSMSFNPSPDRLLVNFPTWLHLSSGWSTVTATASVAGVSATVTAQPIWVRWDMGDGDSVTCHTAGRAYDASETWQQNLSQRDCGYTFRTSSAGQSNNKYGVKVTVHYEVTWSSTAGAGGSLGGYDRTAQSAVTVGQVESLEN